MTITPFPISLVREYYERNKIFLSILIVISVVSPFFGLYFAGMNGVLIGLLFSVLSFFIGLRAVTKVKEISHS